MGGSGRADLGPRWLKRGFQGGQTQVPTSQKPRILGGGVSSDPGPTTYIYIYMPRYYAKGDPAEVCFDIAGVRRTAIFHQIAASIFLSDRSTAGDILCCMCVYTFTTIWPGADMDVVRDFNKLAGRGPKLEVTHPSRTQGRKMNRAKTSRTRGPPPPPTPPP